MDSEDEDQIITKFVGHKKSVASGWISLDEYKLATGGKDNQTILWDIKTQKKIQGEKKEGNTTTDMRWLTYDNYQFFTIKWRL